MIKVDIKNDLIPTYAVTVRNILTVKQVERVGQSGHDETLNSCIC